MKNAELEMLIIPENDGPARFRPCKEGNGKCSMKHLIPVCPVCEIVRRKGSRMTDENCKMKRADTFWIPELNA